MTLSDFHASTILKVRAAFGCLNFQCDPDEITRALGVEPDKAFRKGEARKLPNGQYHKAQISVWGIESQVDSKDVNDHLRQILRRIEGRQSQWSAEFGEPCFDVTWKSNYLYAGNGPFYEADVLAGIVSWKAMLYQDIYQVDQDESENPSPDGFQRIPRDSILPF